MVAWKPHPTTTNPTFFCLVLLTHIYLREIGHQRPVSIRHHGCQSGAHPKGNAPHNAWHVSLSFLLLWLCHQLSVIHGVYLPIPFTVGSLALEQSHDCSSTRKIIRKNMSEINHYHSTVKQSKAQAVGLIPGIYMASTQLSFAWMYHSAFALPSFHSCLFGD